MVHLARNTFFYAETPCIAACSVYQDTRTSTFQIQIHQSRAETPWLLLIDDSPVPSGSVAVVFVSTSCLSAIARSRVVIEGYQMLLLGLTSRQCVMLPGHCSTVRNSSKPHLSPTLWWRALSGYSGRQEVAHWLPGPASAVREAPWLGEVRRCLLFSPRQASTGANSPTGYRRSHGITFPC